MGSFYATESSSISKQIFPADRKSSSQVRSRDHPHRPHFILRANWFDPQMLARQSPARMLRGGMMIPGVDPGPKWIDDTVHFFFQPAGAKSGIDLMSINIQSWILKFSADTVSSTSLI